VPRAPTMAGDSGTGQVFETDVFYLAQAISYALDK
jgi:hypothetical protein